jgi:4-amino-4-deoxychorismate lyase
MALSWVNGQVADTISHQDRGLHYGDGLFETITCLGGRPRWLSFHLDRLRGGCERLALPADLEVIGREIEAQAAAAGRCILKVIVTRGPGLRRGYRPTGSEQCTRILIQYEWPPDSERAVTGFRVAVSDVRLGINPQLAGLKHLNRLEQVMAQAAMPADLEEVLMLSSTGQVIGGSMSNVFLADERGLFTPALADCGIAGVMRQRVLAAGECAGQPVRVRRVQPAELACVREIFLTNVRWGVQPVIELDGRALPGHDWSTAVRRWLDATAD